MKLTLDILRRKGREDEPYIQSFDYETDDLSESVATALTRLNARRVLKDINGKEAEQIRWERNCLQKKCGACAMVINGKPGLACDRRLSECGDRVRIEPLCKFPVIEDLMVDRGIMLENLKSINLWLEGEAIVSEKKSELNYEASRCLQCGCCLEVCPNFVPGGKFTGMASAVPMTRLLSEMPKEQRRNAIKQYAKHIYAGCGKSFACRDICPAGIDTERMLASSNAVALWRVFTK